MNNNGTTRQLVLQELRNQPEGMTLAELRVRLSAMPAAPKSAGKHRPFLLGVIGSLIVAGIVLRKDGSYVLAAPPAGSGESGHE